jgi:DNA-binding MarR family transcriptional regulator
LLIDPLKDFPGYALRRASVAATARLAQRLEPMQLRPAEAAVLLLIGANPGVTQSELGRALDIASANMAPLAMRLRRRALVVREAVDGRSRALLLTAAGRAMTRRVRRTMAEHEAELLSRVPRAQRRALLGALWALSR